MSSKYRADHVGSFLRPPELLAARGSGDAQRLREVEDRAILQVLAKQKDLGFDVFTDGEFRRSNFMGDFTEAVEGFDFGDGLARSWNTAVQGALVGPGPSGSRGRVAGVVVEKLHAVRPLTGHEGFDGPVLFLHPIFPRHILPDAGGRKTIVLRK